MSCPVGQRKFVDYHQGKLSFEDYKKMNKHIATCDTCARKLDEIMNEGSAKRQYRTIFLAKESRNL
ncbi:hypothetical protein [Anaerobacillus sp. CMMVII]|uniref:hypothetical protein n=1 Tax=Anaerobacillus sp. CMMVII TaxID=2755588 RepID=UPI0021B75CF9|nr:hypothetical protein [Anaerobacillus sp. CMMVII]